VIDGDSPRVGSESCSKWLNFYLYTFLVVDKMMGLIQTRKGRYKYFNSLEGYDGGDRLHRLWDIVIARGQGMALILVVHEEINMPQMNLQ